MSSGLQVHYREILYRGVDKHELRVTSTLQRDTLGKEADRRVQCSGIRDMDGDDPTLRLERVKHLTEVAERFTGDNWRQEEVNDLVT